MITGNHASRLGGAIYCTHAANPALTHVTAFGNVSETGNGGVHTFDNSSPIITSSIFWGNNPPTMSAGLSITYSDIENGYNGAGNINQNPLFADQDNANFHLTEDSPCIDTGNPNEPEDPDFTRADMGALYFYQEPLPIITVTPDTLHFGDVLVGDEAEMTVTIVNIGHADLGVPSLDRWRPVPCRLWRLEFSRP